MTVYVESNFVLEVALQQEESDACSELIRLAGEEAVRLVVPAFSMAEPIGAIRAKDKARQRLSNELKSHLEELGRSKQHGALPGTYQSLSAALVKSSQMERDGLRKASTELLRIAEVIPLDSLILLAAAEVEAELGLSGQDAIVLAAVLAHLERERPPASCLLNRNSKDFDGSDVRDRLEFLGCKVITRFDDGLRYVQSRIA